MSTTSSRSDGAGDKVVEYTVVGQRVASGSRAVTAVVLDRGTRQTRAEALARLVESGVDHVIVVLGPGPQYDVEHLAAKLSNVQFLLLARDVTVGERINLAMRESASPYVLTLWSDMDLTAFGDRTMERIREQNALCCVPMLRTDRNEGIPSVIAPAFYRTTLRTVPTLPSASGAPSLYVYADTGLFDRERFLSLGGYDPAIRNPYWQRCDLGFRAFLWGHRIVTLPSLRVTVTRELPADDVTPDAGYARFHLKNLAVKFVRDQGRLPLSAWAAFLLRSGLPLAEAHRVFRDVRRWVRTNGYRFTQDARRVTELWEPGE